MEWRVYTFLDDGVSIRMVILDDQVFVNLPNFGVGKNF